MLKDQTYRITLYYEFEGVPEYEYEVIVDINDVIDFLLERSKHRSSDDQAKLHFSGWGYNRFQDSRDHKDGREQIVALLFDRYELWDQLEGDEDFYDYLIDKYEEDAYDEYAQKYQVEDEIEVGKGEE